MVPSSSQILIIGGGLGGLSAARAACRAGAESVVVIERKRCWGRPIQCAGYVPRLLRRDVPFDTATVKARTETLDVYLRGELLRSIRAPGYILRRDRLEQQMAEAAMEAGATCLQPARALSIGEGSVVVQIGKERAEIQAEIIIGADGPRSATRRAMGLPDPEMAAGLEWELPLTAPLEAAEIHLMPEYGAGYAWVFPYGETAGVGLALDLLHPGNLRELLDDFVSQMVERGKLRRARPTTTVSGLIPVGGPVARTAVDGKALVGDAAGQTNPLTGAGVMAAVTCGEMAGQAAAEAVAAGAPSVLERYEEEWRDLLGGFLERARAGRSRVIEANAEALEEEVRRAWHLGKREAGGSH